MTPQQERFLDQCESFRIEFGLSASRFGRLACRDPNLLYDLRQGRAPSSRIVSRVDGFIRRARDEHQRALNETKGTPNGQKSHR